MKGVDTPQDRAAGRGWSAGQQKHCPLLHFELGLRDLFLVPNLSSREHNNPLLTSLPTVICLRRSAAWAKRHRKRNRAMSMACLCHNQSKESWSSSATVKKIDNGREGQVSHF